MTQKSSCNFCGFMNTLKLVEGVYLEPKKCKKCKRVLR